jgi:uncharacterized protein
MTRLIPWLLAGGACLAKTHPAPAASFICTAAVTKVEHMICADPGLSALDEQLAGAYTTSRSAFDVDTDGAKTLLDDLTQAQRAWVAQRNSCVNAACLRTAYASQIAVLKFQARPGHDAAADHWAGRYAYKGFMHMLVQVRSDDSVRIVITGSEPTQARWSCAFAGIGKVNGPALVSSPASLTGRLAGGAIELPDTPGNQQASDQSCGLNGSIVWMYSRATHS